MRRNRQRVADACDRPNSVGAGPQMHEAAQKLHRHLLLRERVVASAVVAGPHVHHLGDLQLHFLRACMETASDAAKLSESDFDRY